MRDRRCGDPMSSATPESRKVHERRTRPATRSERAARSTTAAAGAPAGPRGVPICSFTGRSAPRWLAGAVVDPLATLPEVRPDDQRAREPAESRDQELGAALRAWADARPGSLEIQLQGPLDAPGMDPTWTLTLSGDVLTAQLVLFYGPVFDVAAARSTGPPGDLHIGGGEGLTPGRLVEMLDELAAVDTGADMPNWLRPAPTVGPA